jgi:hypothetical protein
MPAADPRILPPPAIVSKPNGIRPRMDLAAEVVHSLASKAQIRNTSTAPALDLNCPNQAASRLAAPEQIPFARPLACAGIEIRILGKLTMNMRHERTHPGGTCGDPDGSTPKAAYRDGRWCPLHIALVETGAIGRWRAAG